LWSFEGDNVVKASYYEFFVWFTYVQGWDVVDVLWVVDIKVSKKCVVGGVLVILIDNVITQLAVVRKHIPVVLSISLYKLNRDFKISLGNIVPGVQCDMA
jgi:hypothetical protein